MWIYVEDTTRALQKTAAWYRSQFHIPLVGITGSVGKTTTKEMVALAMSSAYHTMRTEGNQNSQIGLPLTMFRLSEEDEAAVIEMGMSEFGEMARLSAIAKPHHGGDDQHRPVPYRSAENPGEYIKGKAPHHRRLWPGECADSQRGRPAAGFGTGHDGFPVISYGLGADCEYRAEDIENDETGTSFVLVHKGLHLPVFVPAFGIHMVYNALAAVAAAEAARGRPGSSCGGSSGIQTAGYAPAAV